MQHQLNTSPAPPPRITIVEAPGPFLCPTTDRIFQPPTAAHMEGRYNVAYCLHCQVAHLYDLRAYEEPLVPAWASWMMPEPEPAA